MPSTGGFGSVPESGFLDGGGFDHASGLQTVADRHGVSLDAVRHLVQALERGHGTLAQFDHPELGGMGQWTAGGMTMVGRMFDEDLRARVASLCRELAAVLPAEGFRSAATQGRPSGAGQWWPGDLGHPSSTGSQNGLRYAYFPESRRLAIDGPEGVSVYDTGEHVISCVSQSDGLVRFSGPGGPVALDRLRRIEAEAAARAAEAPRTTPPPTAAPPPPAARTAGPPPTDILATIERLADLHARGVLTEREFKDKKAELLARL